MLISHLEGSKLFRFEDLIDWQLQFRFSSSNADLRSVGNAVTFLWFFTRTLIAPMFFAGVELFEKALGRCSQFKSVFIENYCHKYITVPKSCRKRNYSQTLFRECRWTKFDKTILDDVQVWQKLWTTILHFNHFDLFSALLRLAIPINPK